MFVIWIIGMWFMNMVMFVALIFVMFINYYDITGGSSDVVVAEQLVASDEILGFSVTIDGFPYDSLANRIASYWYDTNSDIDMIATFMHEAMFDHNAVGPYGERGLCQLMSNRTNLVWLNDSRWADPMWQAQICLEKREAVPVENRGKIWAAYRWRGKHIDNIVIHR